MEEIKFRYSNMLSILLMWGILFFIVPILVCYTASFFVENFHINPRWYVFIGLSVFYISAVLNDKKGKAVFYDDHVEIFWSRSVKIRISEIVQMSCAYKKGRDFKMLVKTNSKNITIRSSFLETWNKKSENKPQLKNVYDKIYALYCKNQPENDIAKQ